MKEFGMLDLQLFADDPAEPGAEDLNGEEPKDEGKASFDDFLKDPKNQSEFDKRVAAALKKQEAKLSAANEEALKNAQEEAAKLAKMNADQKKEYEMEQLKAENEKLKAENLRTALGRTASELLSDQKITATPEILDFVVGKDAESTKANIEKFVGIIQAQVKAAAVERETGRGTPKDYGHSEPLSEIQKRIAKYR